MTDTTAKEDVRTRWAPHELELVAQRMVELQIATSGLGDLEAVRLAQSVLERQRVINQWQNAKRLDPILARLRAAVADGTFVSKSADGAAVQYAAQPLPAPATVAVVKPAASAPVAAIAPSAEPTRQANDAGQDAIRSDAGASSAIELIASEDPLVLPVVVTTTIVDTVVDQAQVAEIDAIVHETKGVTAEPATAAGGGDAFGDDNDIAIDFYGDGTDVSAKTASESPPASVIRFVDDEPANEIPESIPESIPPSLPSPAVREPVNVFEPVVEKAFVAVKPGASLPTASDIQLALVSALNALVAPEALDKVLRSLAIEGPLDSLARAFEKAIADERDGKLDQEPEADATDTKIFVAGFAGSEQKSIENALSRYDLRVWTPSKGPQAFESMAKLCTIAVISEAMGDDVDEMLRSLKIKIVTHQGSTSRLAERIAEMA